jgi:peptide/nickel transport system permease protein
VGTLLTFIVRRIIAAFFIVIGASFIAFILVSFAGDPLAQAAQIQQPEARRARVLAITASLNLDHNIIVRFFLWLKGVLGCLIGKCDFGQNLAGSSVNVDLANAIGVSLRLITAATVAAIIIGISIGIITALRQYSGLDYTVTFLAFLFFSLPVFWFGVILKDGLGIQFNDFLQDDQGSFSWGTIIVVSLVMGLIAYSLFGGQRYRRLITGGVTAVVVFGVMYYVTVTHWLLDPSLGIVVIIIISVAIGLGVTVLTAGLRNRKALLTAMTTVAVGAALWYPLQFYFYEGFNFLKLVMLLVIAIVVGMIIGYLYGGDDRGLSARTGALTAVGTSFVIFVDRLMRAWASYMDKPQIAGRPIKLTLPRTPLLQGDFWIQTTDILTHLLLPTVTLMLISLATHSRFARASMLEVLNQDYIRTARSKGLTERTVIMRHAFRNALIPLATVVAFDIAGLISGAVLTETVFAWKAMGRLFQDGLTNTDPNPVMAFFVVAAVIAVLANLLADIAYGALDPRIRVKG